MVGAGVGEEGVLNGIYEGLPEEMTNIPKWNGGVLKSLTVAKCAYLLFVGFMVKLYDDLDELYCCTSKRIMACIQTASIIMFSYWIFIMAENKYDLLLIIMVITGMLLDYDAYMRDPFFFSFNLIFPSAILGLFVTKGYSIGILEFVSFFALFVLLCTPFPEWFLMKFNGCIFDWIKPYVHFGDFSEGGWSFFQKTIGELEVSFYKFIGRCFCILYSIICIYLIQYFIRQFSDPAWKQMFQSFLYMNVIWIGYCLLSCFNQLHVLYFCPDILKLHRTERSNPTNLDEHI
jgi:hypothetical protein